MRTFRRACPRSRTPPRNYTGLRRPTCAPRSRPSSIPTLTPCPLPRRCCRAMLERTHIGLKVDVDTLRGTREGVPRLAALFKKLKVDASFYFSVGPDHTGRAMRRVLRTEGRAHLGAQALWLENLALRGAAAGPGYRPRGRRVHARCGRWRLRSGAAHL